MDGKNATKSSIRTYYQTLNDSVERTVGFGLEDMKDAALYYLYLGLTLLFWFYLRLVAQISYFFRPSLQKKLVRSLESILPHEVTFSESWQEIFLKAHGIKTL